MAVIECLPLHQLRFQINIVLIELVERKPSVSRVDTLQEVKPAHRSLISENGFAPADFLQGDFAALLIELFEPIKAASAVAHHFAGLADAVGGFG